MDDYSKLKADFDRMAAAERQKVVDQSPEIADLRAKLAEAIDQAARDARRADANAAKLTEAEAACAEMREALGWAADDLDGCLHGYDANGRMDREDEASAEETLSNVRALLTRTDLGREWVPLEVVGRLVQWTQTYGATLCPPGPDTYGEGMRAAKDQVRRILDTFLKGDG